MKTALRLATALLCLALTSCLFKEPIFTSGFAPADPALGGVWMAEAEGGDPRERDFAVVAAIGSDSYMLHYPVARKGGTYFEARPLKVRDKDLWQVRLAVTYDDGLPDKDTPTYTILWLEKTGDNKLSVRSLKSEGPHTTGPAEARKALEDKAADWNILFGEAQVFTRLADK
ncbi:MAG TPA: hypothetical protein VD994_16820 [Prosthecobacter sp.]|nr:hypothetical protein [Prosthecobacter sp.]